MLKFIYLNRNFLFFFLFVVFKPFSVISSDRALVVATSTIIHNIAKNIAAEKINVHSLLPVGADPHIYEPVPGDIKILANADLILINGLYLEGKWLQSLIENSGQSNDIIINTTNGITPLFSDDGGSYPDPHAWMSPQNGKVYAANIYRAFLDLDPENGEYYTANYQSYIKKLDELDDYIQKKISRLEPQKRVLITTHDAFAYYGNTYGMEVHAAMGFSTDADIRLSDVKNIIQLVKERNLPAIFVESTINPKLFVQLAQDLKIIIGGELFSDSLGDEESEASTYLDMLKFNTDTIYQALSGQGMHTSHTESLLWFFISLFIVFIAAFILAIKNLQVKSKNTDLKNSKLEIKGLNVSYEKKTVLTNIYLTFESGKLYGLVGPNGAGKSTLFKAILNLLKPDSGQITINDDSVLFYKKHIAYVPQKDELDWSFPTTVFDVVLTGRYPHKTFFSNINKKDKQIALNAIKQMDIENLKNKQIGELSGGQQQRVFLARALCQEAMIYLLDEPFVGVDITTEEKIYKIVKKLSEEGKIILIVHHDLAKVSTYFDEVVMINQRLIAAGKTGKVFTNENIRKTFSSKLTLLQKTDSYIYADKK